QCPFQPRLGQERHAIARLDPQLAQAQRDRPHPLLRLPVRDRGPGAARLVTERGGVARILLHGIEEQPRQGARVHGRNLTTRVTLSRAGPAANSVSAAASIRMAIGLLVRSPTLAWMRAGVALPARATITPVVSFTTVSSAVSNVAQRIVAGTGSPRPSKATPIGRRVSSSSSESGTSA